MPVWRSVLCGVSCHLNKVWVQQSNMHVSSTVFCSKFLFNSTQFYNPPGGNLYCQCGVIFKTNDIQGSEQKKAGSECLFHKWMRKNRSVTRAGIYWRGLGIHGALSGLLRKSLWKGMKQKTQKKLVNFLILLNELKISGKSSRLQFKGQL